MPTQLLLMLWLMLMLVLRKALKTGWWQQTAWQQLFTEQPPHNLWMFGRSLGLACLGSCRQHCFLNICRYIYWLNWQILYLSIWPVHLKILREQCCLGSWVFFVKSTQNSGPLCLWQRFILVLLLILVILLMLLLMHICWYLGWYQYVGVNMLTINMYSILK